MTRRAAEIVPLVALVVAGALWCVSLALPSIGARGGPTLTGYEVLIDGWRGIRYGVLAWAANPLLLVSIGCTATGHARAGAAAGLLGLLLGLSTGWANELAAAFGRPVPELFLRQGFYFWMAAQLAAATGGIFSMRGSPRAGRNHPPAMRD